MIKTHRSLGLAAALVCGALVPGTSRFARRRLVEHIATFLDTQDVRVHRGATIPCFAGIALASASKRFGGAEAGSSAGAAKQ